MSLRWVIAGVAGQLVLGGFLFMYVAFSAAGVVNEHVLSKLQTGILNFSMFALPLICVLSAGIVLFQYKNGGSATSYWWHVAPILAVALYTFYVSRLS